MNILPLFHFLTFLFYVYLIVYVLLKNRKNVLNRLCAFIIFCFALWSLGDALLYNPRVPLNIIEKVIDYYSFGWSYIPIAILSFSFLFTEKYSIVKNKAFKLFFILFPLIFVYNQFAGNIFSNFVKKDFGWFSGWPDSNLSYLFFAYFGVCILISLFLFVDFRKKTFSVYKRKQAAIMLGTTFFYFLTSAVSSIYLSVVKIATPEIGGSIGLVWVGGVIYSMNRYGFMTVTPAAAAKNILATMADALLLIGPKRKIVSVNDSTCRFLNYRKEDLIGKKATDFLKEKEFLAVPQARKSLKEKGILRNYETVLMSGSNEEIPVSLSVSLLKDNYGQLVGMICVVKDMRGIKRMMNRLETLVERAKLSAEAEKQKSAELSEVHRELKEKTLRLEKRRIAMVRMLERLNRSRKEAERANKSKNEFLANMSHELRTPLNAIIGFSDILLSKSFGNLTEKQEEYLNDISYSGRHLLSLINDILDISKIESGKEELKLGQFSLPKLGQESIDMFKQRCLKNNLHIELNTDTKKDFIIADKRKIKQVFFNLVSNATKFTPEGGEIGINIKEKEKDYLIEVWDTGQGIDEEGKKKIFDKFQQLDRGYSKKYAGTGLGLSLVKEFVNLHLGRIWVESEVDKGSNLRFTIPKDLGYRIFNKDIDAILQRAGKSGYSLTFVMMRFQTKGDTVAFFSDEVTSVVDEGLRETDKRYSLDGGICIVLLGRISVSDIDKIVKRVKERVIDKYFEIQKIKNKNDINLLTKMFYYPDKVVSKKGIISKLKEFGMF